MYNMTVFNAIQCERGAGNHQVEGVLNGRAGVRFEHREIVNQLMSNASRKSGCNQREIYTR